jgi:hypothetical protein
MQFLECESHVVREPHAVSRRYGYRENLLRNGGTAHREHVVEAEVRPKRTKQLTGVQLESLLTAVETITTQRAEPARCYIAIKDFSAAHPVSSAESGALTGDPFAARVTVRPNVVDHSNRRRGSNVSNGLNVIIGDLVWARARVSAPHAPCTVEDVSCRYQAAVTRGKHLDVAVADEVPECKHVGHMGLAIALKTIKVLFPRDGAEEATHAKVLVR